MIKGRRSISGFTLIEILVVIFIMSIVTSVALLSVGRNENRQLESFAKELVQTVTLAQEQAMLQPSVLGLSIEKHAYQFAAYRLAENKKKNVWSPLTDHLLGIHTIPHNVELTVEMGGQKIAQEDDVAHAPQVVISTNGDITPFTIYIGKKGKSPRYVIKGDADGTITSKLLS